jgi:hypothetical protein
MLDYIEKQKHKNDLELLGIVTNTWIKDSFMVFYEGTHYN